MSRNCSNNKKVSWETDFFYKSYVSNKNSRRHCDGCRKPVPREKGREEEKSIILHLNSHKYLEGNEKDDGKKNGIQERPENTEDCPLILESYLLLGEKEEKVFLPFKIPIIHHNSNL